MSTKLWDRLSQGISTAGTVLLILALGVALTACGDEDDGMGPGMEPSPPSVVGSIENQDLVVNDENPDVDDTEEIEISGVFEGEELTFSASSGNSGVATASVDGSTLTVDPDNGGSATITVTAENDAGSTDTSFEVSVTLPNAPDPPNGS